MDPRLVSLFLLVLAAGEASPLMETGEQLVNSVLGLFYEPTYETATYDLISTSPDGVEEREYPVRNWVCTHKEVAEDEEDDTTGMFWRLFGYIQGENEQGVKIPMTTPVTTLVSPSIEGLVLEMCFYIGSGHQASPPAPTQQGVFIQAVGRRVFTRQLSGYMSRSGWQREVKDLYTLLKASGKIVNPNRYLKVGYDSPFKWWNRRNEVWYTSLL